MSRSPSSGRWTGSPMTRTASSARARASATRLVRVGYLGLGSNVGDRASQLRGAIDDLRVHGVEVEAVSSLYETEPVGEIPRPAGLPQRRHSDPDLARAGAAARTLKGDRGRARASLRRAPPRAPPDRHRPAAARRDRDEDGPTHPSSPRGHLEALRSGAPARARPGAATARRNRAAEPRSRISARASASSGSLRRPASERARRASPPGRPAASDRGTRARPGSPSRRRAGPR